MIPSYIVDLHKSLDQRLRPEDVLEVIARGCPEAVRVQPGRRVHHWSSMTNDFARPVDGAGVLESVGVAFQQDIPPTDPTNGWALRDTADELGSQLGWHSGHENQGRSSHLSRSQRAELGIGLSRRKYNRQWRALRRLNRKATKLETEQRKRELLIIGRSGFTSRITLERFAADPTAAHFIAYWVARKNLRREFSLDGKQNPMDKVAAEFLSCCDDSTNWAMIALARPTPDVLAHLTDYQVGDLLGQWYSVMREAADLLKRAWSPSINRTEMVVRRGNDSSTWNTIAQAYNSARASWLACISAVGAQQLLTATCPGKAMRLMAADLVRWHRGELDPNTQVWATLPLPWDVLDGRVLCGRVHVEAACLAAGLDPRESGWTAPRSPGEIAPFAFTLELVHGVSVADPVWAGLLRRAGVFSGKRLSDDPELVATAVHGLVHGVVISDLPSKIETE